MNTSNRHFDKHCQLNCCLGNNRQAVSGAYFPYGADFNTFHHLGFWVVQEGKFVWKLQL